MTQSQQVLPAKASRDPRAPWWTLRLLGVAVLAWAVGAGYSLRGNLEVAFYREGHEVKHRWASEMARTQTNKTVVVGGSSCATSIKPRRMLERHGLAVLNAGLAAGMGARVLARYGMESVRPGDTLIVALEPDLLATTIELEPLGVQWAIATGQLPLLRGPSGLDWPDVAVKLRPGGYHVLTLLGKILLRQPLYRYVPRDFHSDGWQQVIVRRDLGNPVVTRIQLSAAGRQLLAEIRDECARRQVRVAYKLNWQFATPENLEATRRANRAFLDAVAQVMPVLREPSLGAYSVREQFADTNLHLTSEGADLLTDEFAVALKAWDVFIDRGSQPEPDSGNMK